jgi:nucleotide-binding universal stress UspA family protein
MNMKMPLKQQITHIAAVVDLGDVDPAGIAAEPAVEQARRLARRTGSALTILAIASSPTLRRVLALKGREDVNPRDQLKAPLFDMATRIQREDGITVLSDLRIGQFDAVFIADWLSSHPVDLAVLNKPDQLATAPTVMSRLSVVIRQTGVPVWFARQGTQPQTGVLAAVSHGVEEPSGDVRALDYEVMDTARGVGALFDAELHVVQAREHGSWEESLAYRKNALKSFAVATGAADEVEQIVVAKGKTAQVISDSVETLETGLIVMGASEKSRWEAMLFGGTAEETLTLAPCDVLYVKNSEGDHVRPQTVLSAHALESEPELSEVDLVVNPRRHFATPLALMRDENLDRQSKVLILQAWREELENEDANEHNMPQNVFEPVTSRQELLEVRRALVRLGVAE